MGAEGLWTPLGTAQVLAASHVFDADEGNSEMTGQFARRGVRAWRRAFRVPISCFVVCAMFSGGAFAQQKPAPQTAGTIRGEVKDPSGAVVAGAVVTLETAGTTRQRTAISDQGGRFQFSGVGTGSYRITITASGFADWTADTVTPVSGDNASQISAALRLAPASTQVSVTLPPHELAAEQIKAEEKQRVIGVFPNYFVTYQPNAAPLTAKQKFELGWKTFFDPVPILFSGVGAGIQQAQNRFPEYGQGVEGFSKRFGANYADRVDDVLIGHVVMQSVFHQDPRYFYKGTGSFGSRVLYALATAFVAKGDNGHWQPAYADVLGGMGSYGISTLYRPGTSRPGLRLEHTILLDFAGRATDNLLEEFVLRKVSTHVPKTTASQSQSILRAGTPVTLISMEDLHTKSAENTGPIGFVLASDLRVGGVIVAKAGSQAWGRVNYTAAPSGDGIKVDLGRVHLTAGALNVPLRSTQMRNGSSTVGYHRLENSGRIVIVLYVDKDVTIAPGQ